MAVYINYSWEKEDGFYKKMCFLTTLELSRMHIKYMSKDNMATKFLTKGFQKGIQDIRIIAIGCSNSWFKKIRIS